MSDIINAGRKLRRVVDIIEELRKLSPEMQIQTAMTLLQVGLEPGITMKRLCEKVGISQASISRNVAILGDGLRPEKPGFKLLTAKEDPYERRRKIVTLTPAGVRVCNSLESYISDE